MSLEPSQQADDGKRPAFTGRFPILAAGTPADQGSGDQRPTFSAPASGPAQTLTSGPACSGDQDADPPPSADEATGSASGTRQSGAAGATAADAAGSAAADADQAGSGGEPPAPEATAALQPSVRSATSGVMGTADTTRGTGTNGAAGSTGTTDVPSTTRTAGASSTAGTADATSATRTAGTTSATPTADAASTTPTASTVGTIGTARTPAMTGTVGTGTTGTADTPTTAGRDGSARTAGSAGSAGSAGPSGPAGAGADGLEGLDGPLLGDTVGLRSNWERLQAGFVDDPEDAVADAAELVEHTVQALIGALRQRQRALRELAKRGPAAGQGADAGDPAGPQGARPSGPDTEHLRRMMLRYRSLFNQLCRP
jgi:hypothetical protein